jgi:hypothetical protein
MSLQKQATIQLNHYPAGKEYASPHLSNESTYKSDYSISSEKKQNRERWCETLIKTASGARRQNMLKFWGLNSFQAAPKHR